MKNKYDVIIVGCGVAGCYAALHLPPDYSILMLSKSALKDCDSYLAQGGICMLKSGDDFDSYMEDTLRAGHYENNKESVKIMINTSREVIKELIGYGVSFHETDGNLDFTREGAHSTNRILYHDDITGKEITSVLQNQISLRANITIADNTTMIDLLCRNNRCHGILIEQKKEITPIFGNDIILACGGLGGIFENSTNYPLLTGDALSLSLKRGVKLKKVDYIQIHPTTLYSQKPGRRFLISESVRGEGALLLDKNGNRFVNELLPRDVVSNAIFTQMKKDHTDHVWLSMETIPQDINVRFPNIVKRCIEEGYNPQKEPIPVVPAQHYLMGGIQTDTNGCTTMCHLFAVGETANNGVHGANRLASNSLLESLVFAGRASSYITGHRDITHANYEKEQLYEFFNIDLNEYKNMDEYNRLLRDSLLAEIKIEKENHQNGSDYQQTKCG